MTDSLSYHLDDTWTIPHALQVVNQHGIPANDFIEFMMNEHSEDYFDGETYAVNVLEWLGY